MFCVAMKKTKILFLLLTVMVASLVIYSNYVYHQSAASSFIEQDYSNVLTSPMAGMVERVRKDGRGSREGDGSELAVNQLHASTKEPEAGTSETNTSGTLVNRLSMEVTTSWQERALFQQAQVGKFCQDYNMADIKFKLPAANQETDAYYRHMLVDDQAKTIFCFVPKSGCTSLNVLFFINQGLLPESELQQSGGHLVNPSQLQSLIAEHSFGHLNNSQRVYTLKNYFKFVMYRNPLERLVSGYRNKVQRYPLIGTEWGSPQYNWLRRSVYKFKHPKEYKVWCDAGSKTPVQISFPDFIDYWLSQPPALQHDEHFRPITELCHPCRSRFDFYGNFRNFEEDAAVLRMRIGAEEKFLRRSYYNSTTQTYSLLVDYYKQLDEKQKRSVFEHLRLELDFVYRIFPEELNTHKQILRIVDDIPSPTV